MKQIVILVYLLYFVRSSENANSQRTRLYISQQHALTLYTECACACVCYSSESEWFSTYLNSGFSYFPADSLIFIPVVSWICNDFLCFHVAFNFHLHSVWRHFTETGLKSELIGTVTLQPQSVRCFQSKTFFHILGNLNWIVLLLQKIKNACVSQA